MTQADNTPVRRETSGMGGNADRRRQWTSKRYVRLLSVGFVLLALAMRWHEASSRDLYNDEAIATTIARSFLEDGSLNNWRYSRFLPPTQHRGDIWIYYPPLFVFAQSTLLWLHPSGGNLLPRLPVALANVAALLLLPLLSRAAGRGTAAGWMAAAMLVIAPFHVHTSVTALPYSLMGPLLSLALVLLFYRGESARRRDWVLVPLVVLIGFHIHPLALGFVGFLAVIVLWALAQGDQRRAWHAVLTATAIVIGAVPWLCWSFGRSTTLGSFMTLAPNYTLSAQAALVGELWGSMLPGPILGIAMVVGIASGLYGLVRGRNLPGGLIALWALSPVAYLASRSMWLTPRHVAFALPAVYLTSAWGLLLVMRGLLGLAARLLPAAAIARIRAGGMAACLLIFAAEHFATPPQSAQEDPRRVAYILRHGDAALEFGGSDTVSHACTLLRQRRRNEQVIAPVGISESYYLESFVHDRRNQERTDLAWQLLAAGPAWVFVGDNFLGRGSFDDFDRFVVTHGELIFRAPPVAGFTDPSNTVGYGLYFVTSASAAKTTIQAD